MQRLMHDFRGSNDQAQFRRFRDVGLAQQDCSAMLGRTRFFQGVDAALLRQLAGDATRKVLARDAELFRQDDPATTLFMVMEGNIKLV